MIVVSSNRCVVPNDTKKKNRRCQHKKKVQKGGGRGGVEGRGARIKMNSANWKKKPPRSRCTSTQGLVCNLEMRKIVRHLLLDCRGSHLALSWTYLDRISSLSSVHISGSPWVSQKDSPNKLDVFLFHRKLLSASSRELFKVFHYFPLVVFFFFFFLALALALMDQVLVIINK